MKIGNKEFDLSSHCYIMGILNVHRILFRMAVNLIRWMRH